MGIKLDTRNVWWHRKKIHTFHQISICCSNQALSNYPNVPSKIHSKQYSKPQFEPLPTSCFWLLTLLNQTRKSPEPRSDPTSTRSKSDFTPPELDSLHQSTVQRSPFSQTPWQLNYIDVQCKFTDSFFSLKTVNFQTVSICKVTAKAVFKFTLKVYVNKLSPSVTLQEEDLRKKGGGGCENLKSALMPSPRQSPIQTTTHALHKTTFCLIKLCP